MIIRFFRNIGLLVRGDIKLKNIFHLFHIVIVNNGKVIIGKKVKLFRGSILKVSDGLLQIDDNVQIGYSVRFSVKDTHIKNNVRINQNSIISGNIIIEDNVIISPFVSFISDKHSFNDRNYSVDMNDFYFGMKTGKIFVDRNTYIGAYSFILGNTHIGINCIVDANCYLKECVVGDYKIISSEKNFKLKDRL